MESIPIPEEIVPPEHVWLRLDFSNLKTKQQIQVVYKTLLKIPDNDYEINSFIKYYQKNRLTIQFNSVKREVERDIVKKKKMIMDGNIPKMKKQKKKK